MRASNTIAYSVALVAACASIVVASRAAAQARDAEAPSNGEEAESDDYLSSLQREIEAREIAAEEESIGPFWFLDDWTIFTGFELGILDVGPVGFGRDQARRGRYGDNGLAVNILSLRSRFFRLLNVELMFGYMDMDDYDPIMNEVVCVINCSSDAEPFVAESEVSALTVSAATGLATPPIALGPVGLTLGCNLGVQAAWPHRDIMDCRDCDEEDLADLSGTYLEPTMLIGWAAKLDSRESGMFGIRASYRAFLGDSELRYSWTFGFALAMYLEVN